MFNKEQKKLAYIVIFLIVAFFALIKSKMLVLIRSQILSGTSFSSQILSTPLLEIKKIIYYHKTFEEYKKLKKQVDVLKHRLIGLEEVIRENSRLESLLKMKRNLVFSSVVASVIGRAPSNWNSIMIIDKGSNDSIVVGMPVVNANGIVGKIVEVNDSTSKVMLLIDSQFSVAALVKRLSESVLVQGSLTGQCKLSYLNDDADVKLGDVIVTSKLSSSFPEGLIVGYISEVNRDSSDTSPRCIVKPAVTFSQIEEVLVIKK